MKVLLFSILIFVLSLSTAFAECEKAMEYYEKAVSESDVQKRIQLLQFSLEDCRSFAAYYELGKAFAMNDDLEKAISTLKKAFSYTDQKEEKSQTLWLMGKIYRNYDRPQDAIICYKTALKLSKNGNRQWEEELMELEKQAVGSVVSSDQIISTLQKGIKNTRSIGVVGVPPSIDLRVYFEFGSHALTEQGKRQADELGKAIASSAFQGKQFRLLGHTDSRGSDQFNQRLSERRANTVRSLLVERFDVAPERITAEGRGEGEILYHDQTEEAHALNRRVEVVVEMTP
jgi:outer membrane protein OmpA-like peptidoglycan-associated protein